jgi:nuclear pore complex protein Nup210
LVFLQTFSTLLQTSFTVGDVVCFESALSDPSTWSSSNQRVASVHPNTGVARILSAASQIDEKATITHGSSSGSHINFELDIRGADKLEFIKTYDIFSGATYRGYVIIKNSLQTDKFTNMVHIEWKFRSISSFISDKIVGLFCSQIAKNVTQCAKLIDEFQVNLFACRLDVKQQSAMANNKLLDHFKTYAIFDRNSGTYGCEIELLTSLNSIVDLIKNADISFELQVSNEMGLNGVFF